MSGRPKRGTLLWSHVGGFVTGFVVAAVFAAVGCIRPTPDEETLLEVLGIGLRR